jgi:hypothetical protein
MRVSVRKILGFTLHVTTFALLVIAGACTAEDFGPMQSGMGASGAGTPPVAGIGGAAAGTSGGDAPAAGAGSSALDPAGSGGTGGTDRAGAGGAGTQGAAGEAGDAGSAGMPPADECPDDPDKTEPGDCGCGMPDTDDNDDGVADCNEVATVCQVVTPVPDELRRRLNLHAFYEKHADANGVPILSSRAPTDESLLLACRLVNHMLSERDDVRQALITSGARFAIIGRNEGTAEIPEYGYRDGPQSEIDRINQRARGLGGIVASCGEENILCLAGDRYRNESICVHEFAHTISIYGAYRADRTFRTRLESAYTSARNRGILANTYRLENAQEYWAEGVQDWYDTNAQSSPANGVHNSINTKVELESYDPTLYALVGELFPEDNVWGDCRRR